ncbi:hypothetical protein GCM10027570_03860 [Streptomonospora sediminis]
MAPEKSSSAPGNAALSATARMAAAATQTVVKSRGRRVPRAMSAAVALHATKAQTNASPTSTIPLMMVHAKTQP